MVKKHKYIEKHRSKSGKWVYTYENGLTNGLLSSTMSIFNSVGLGGTDSNHVQMHVNAPSHAHPQPRYDRDNKPRVKKVRSSSVYGRIKKFASSHNPAVVTDKTVIKGPGRTVTTEVSRKLFGGKKVSEKRTTEYRTKSDKSFDKQQNAKIAERNKKARSGKSIFSKKLMDFNDKYGPKTVQTITHSSSVEPGRSYVTKISSNIFGGRTVSLDSYTQDVTIAPYGNSGRKAHALHKRKGSEHYMGPKEILESAQSIGAFKARRSYRKHKKSN